MNNCDMADAWRILMLFFLSHECFAQFTLDPDGVVRVCTGQNQQFQCTSGGVSWSISGFGNGILDTPFPASAVDYAKDNMRVTTTDDSTVSDPSTLTFMMLGYPDDNASVTCINSMRSRMITSTIQIAPTYCTRNFTELNTTSTTITIKLAVSNCDGSMPIYRVTARSMSSGVVTTALNITSTVYLMSSLEAATAYNVELVDIECQNVILSNLSVMTRMDPTSSTPLLTPTSIPTGATLTNVPAIVGGTVGGLIAVVLAVIIIVVAAVIIKQKNVKKAGGEGLTAQHGEEMVDVHGDTTYAAPDKNKATVEGEDGVYSYAATTTVVGAQHSKQGGETKATENVSVQPGKPKRGSKKQPPPADVPHKQGPVGDLYAMPDKKAPDVGHKAGPQGDMYAMAAKPSKGGYGAEGP